MKSIFISIVFFCCFMNVNGSLFFLKNRTEPLYIRTPYLKTSPIQPPFNVTSVLLPLGTTQEAMQNCTHADPILAPFLKGAIVIVVPDNGCSIPGHVMVAQNAGAVGCLVLTLSTSFFSNMDTSSPSELTIPVLFIEVDDFTKHLADELANVVIMKAEANPVKKKFPYFIKQIDEDFNSLILEHFG